VDNYFRKKGNIDFKKIGLKNNRQRFFWLVSFVLLVFIGDRLGGFLLQQVTASSQFRYSRLYQGKAQADILLLGNSRGLGLYQPYVEEFTGKTTFNLSYNGLPADAARVLVQDYLERYQPPELLLIDITLCDRRNPQLLAGFNLYVPYSKRIADVLAEQVPKSYHGGNVSHLYRYNSEIFQRTLFHFSKTDEEWLIDRTITPELADSVQNQAVYDIELHPYLLKNLAELVQIAQESDVQVALVISPYFLPYAERMQSLLPLKKAVEELTELPVHDYSQALPKTDYFGDYQHVNKKGSRAYLQLLVKDGILK